MLTLRPWLEKDRDMQDEIYDRYYQAGRQELHAGLDRGLQRVGHSIAAAFNALHDINFAAPWREGKPVCQNDRAGLA